jgi:uncharacterized membrane protein (UPF0127 family)
MSSDDRALCRGVWRVDQPEPDELDAPPSRFDGLARHELSGGLTLVVAGTRAARGRGLARLDVLAADHALLIECCRSIHTVGMRFVLDLLWLDAAGAVVRIDADVAPHRLRSCRRARAVIECNAGQGDRFAASLPPPAPAERPRADDEAHPAGTTTPAADCTRGRSEVLPHRPGRRP